MPPSWFWLKRDQEFIKVLEHYEQTNAFGNNYSNDNPLWKVISGKVKLPAPYCRKKWLVMKYTYMKLKNMIRVGRVTEIQVRLNIKTNKYLDGRLDFLDRFSWQIPDATLLTSVHRFFDSLFGAGVYTPFTTHGDTTSDVDVEKLLTVKKTSVPQVIVAFKQEPGTEPTCILPEMENNVSEPTVNLETEQAIKKDYDEDSDDVEFQVTPIELHQVFLPSTQLHQNDPVGDVEQRSVSKRGKRITHYPRCSNNIYSFLVKYSNSNIEKEVCDLKQYMNDLGQVLCNRLTPGNRKQFLSQIDLIVSEMLEAGT